MTKTDIYVGLNDQQTKQQTHNTSKYVSVLKTVCRNYRVPFSFNVIEGGYIHESGEYTQEVPLMLSLIDVEDGIINEIAKDLCFFFNQESVLITKGEVETFTVTAESYSPVEAED